MQSRTITWANIASIVGALIVFGLVPIVGSIIRFNRNEWDQHEVATKVEELSKRVDAHDAALSTANIQLGSINAKLDILLNIKGQKP